MAKEMTVQEAAALLGINRRSVVYAIERGVIEARKESGVLYKCLSASVRAYKRRRDKAAMEATPAASQRHKSNGTAHARKRRRPSVSRRRS